MSSFQQLTLNRHEYQMKAWYRAILLIFGAFAVSGAIAMGYLASRTSRISLPYFMIAIFLFFGIYLIALAMRSRVIIDGNRIEIRGAFTNHYAETTEIEGYRTINSRNGNYTQFYLSGGRRPITLSVYFDRDQAFDEWMRNIPNLDKRDRDRILEEISQQEELGATPQERLAALAQAKTYAIFALVIAIAAAVAANFGVPALYLPFSVALALVPFALAILLHRSPLLYTVFKRREDPRAELFYALIVSSLGLLIRAHGIHFVSLHSVGPVIAILTVAYIAAFYHSFFESTSPTRTFFALLLFGMLYSYGAVVVADAVGDTSTPTRYVVHVLGKHYTTGRSRSYYLTLEPWGPVEQPNSLGVSKSIYDKASPGDQVCLELSSGRLNSPWYTQVSCSNAPFDPAQ
ncbi:hypothetical protein P8935_09355 [Telmatobacter sp. DSM 110680]|uniref:DUF3592 domain-containing protein n=1 Tax=Telmatobacter sp. DSM 110680 TaxID=3036704 RepID=A0AAU7DPD8_9BACT